MKSKNTALITILGALYVVIGLAIPSIGFGAIQCRISDALHALIVVFGMPAVIGLTLGELIYNLYGFSTGFALGTLDLLSPIIFIIPKLLIYKIGYKGLLVHVAFIAVWVAYLLSLFNVPFFSSIITVGVGSFIAEVVLGIPLAKIVENRFDQERR